MPPGCKPLINCEKADQVKMYLIFLDEIQIYWRHVMIGINFRAVNSFDINSNQAKTPSEKNNLAILDYFMIQIKNMRI